MASETITPTPRDPIDIQAIVARIDRDIRESRRASEETFKLIEERKKLEAETRKLDRDRWLAPWALGAAILGGVIVAVAHRLIGG